MIEHVWNVKEALYKDRGLTHEAVLLLKSDLSQSAFHFSPMQRFFIPKANKPGKFRPITKPTIQDRLVMDAISLFFNDYYDKIFLSSSYGYRRGRDPGGISKAPEKEFKEARELVTESNTFPLAYPTYR